MRRLWDWVTGHPWRAFWINVVGGLAALAVLPAVVVVVPFVLAAIGLRDASFIYYPVSVLATATQYVWLALGLVTGVLGIRASLSRRGIIGGSMRLAIVATVVGVGVVTLYFLASWFHGQQVAHTRIARAQADTRDIASAIQRYATHCGGLPIGDTATDCATRSELGGPFPVPGVLTRQQTNKAGQVAGPFMAELPKWYIPHDLAGQVGDSYAYFILPGNKFVVCAAVASYAQGGNSDGGTTCP